MVAVKTQRRVTKEARERRGKVGAESVMDDAERKRRAKQERARLRRAIRRQEITADSRALVARAMQKPLEDWDVEELAVGSPRNADGSLPRRKANFIPRAVHEEAIARFREIAASDLRVIVPDAIQLVHDLILNNDMDDKGKMVVPPSVKLDAAKWVVEHLVGKPRQPVDVDVSVKLQGILANVMVSPEEIAQRRNAEFIPAVGRDLVGDEE